MTAVCKSMLAAETWPPICPNFISWEIGAQIHVKLTNTY